MPNKDILTLTAAAGYTFEELSKAITELQAKVTPIGDNEIEMIKHNPNLSFLQKRRLIKQIKKWSK